MNSPQMQMWIGQCQLVLAADGGLSQAREHRIPVDIFVGDADSCGIPLDEMGQWAKESIVLSTAKDDSDTEAAIKVALERGSDEIWIFGGSGMRMDHWLSNLKTIERTPQVVQWFTPWERIVRLRSGSASFEGTVVSIFPIGDGPWTLTSEGLRWPLGNFDFSKGHSLSNEVVDGRFSLAVKEGDFLVFFPGGSL